MNKSPWEVCRAECSCQHLVQYCIQESACNARSCRRQGFDPGWGKSPGGGSGNPLQYSCRDNSKDRGAWRAAVHGVSELDTTERTWLRMLQRLCGTVCQSGSAADNVKNSSSIFPLNLWDDPGSELGEPLPQRHVPSLDFNANHPFSLGTGFSSDAGCVCVCVCVCVWLNINLSLKPYICVQLNPGALHTQTSIQGFTATREPGSPDSGFQVAWAGACEWHCCSHSLIHQMFSLIVLFALSFLQVPFVGSGQGGFPSIPTLLKLLCY